MHFSAKQLVIALPLIVATTACDSLSGSDEPDVTVSFAVPGTSSSNSSVMAAVADPITVNGHTLDLQSADITFSKIKLDRVDSFDDGDSDTDVDSDIDSDSDAESDAEGDSDSEGDSDEEETLRFGTTTVALPLNGGVITPITVAIPEGSYESIELKIATVRLRGTFDGNAFDITVPVHEDIEQKFSPAFVVDSDDDHPNITIAIDVSDWFVKNGTLIDPRAFATNKELRATLRDLIEQSFKAFEDADRDADDRDSDSDSR